jgi:UDP-galactopyranose mutase
VRVVVVGGGYGGLAAAARLAKLGHEVALVEAGPELGGALVPVRAEGYTWDGGPSYLTLPAVVRDLFRKSGRPLETELGEELEPLPVVREHRFEDDTAIAVPAGSRAAQVAAFDELGPGLGQRWSAWVDPFADTWDLLRRGYAETPYDAASAPAGLPALLDARETLLKRLRKAFRDDRLATIAGHPFVAGGHDLRNVPTWAGLEAYLEQCFGLWRVPPGLGGMGRLRDLLEDRLRQREVVVLREAPVSDLVVREGRAVGVRTALGQLDADAVVVAVDPRRLPALAPLVARSMPAIPPVVAHLGLMGRPGDDLPELPHEVVLHGDPMIVVRTGGQAPEGGTAWTVHARGRIEEDVLRTLARRGLDVRDRIATRVDRSPVDLVRAWGGSPYGVLWEGRGTVRQRLGPTTPVTGVFACGAHAAPGSGLAFVGLSAALVAQAIGPA